METGEEPGRRGVPRHVQISDWLRAQINDGVLRADDRLPSESQLVRRFSVSRITVRRALQTLESDHLIYRHQGLGSFVKDPHVHQGLVRLTDFVEDMEAAGIVARSEVLHFKPETAPSSIASLLRIEEGVSVMRLDRLRFGDGEPLAFDSTWLPVFYAQLLDGKDLEGDSIYRILERDYDISVNRGRYRIEAVNASNEIAQNLQLPWGRALLMIERISYSDNERAVYVQQRYYRSDRVAFDLELERSPSGVADPRRGMPLCEFEPIFKK